MIKRYYLDSGLDPCNSCVFTEDETGEWVRWDDVECFLRSIYSDIDSQCESIWSAEKELSVMLGEISLLLDGASED